MSKINQIPNAMFKKNLFVFVLLLSGLSIMSACKKDDNDDDPIQPAPAVICVGKGSTSNFPLALNNKWTLTATGNTYSITMVDSAIFNSVKYFEGNSNTGAIRYYRKLSNGDVVLLNNSGVDEIFVPGNPTVGQTWNYSFDFCTSRKVIGINETVTTSSCTYTGCIKIQNFDGATAKRIDYFKRGVGLVKTNTIGVEVKLSSLTLK